MTCDSRMSCGSFVCSRNTLILLNIMYFCVGGMLVCLAAYAKALAIITTIPAISGIITCGVFLAMIAVAGLIGAIKHHQVLLFFKGFFYLGWKLASQSLRNKTQIMLDCCGMDIYHQTNNDSYPDYNHPTCYSQNCNMTGNRSICCYGDKEHFNFTGEDKCYVNDCWKVIEPQLHQLVRAVGAIGLFFSFSEIIGIWLTFRYRNQKDPRANPSAFL